MSQYENFAYIYDELMSEVDYEKWLDFMTKKFKENPLAIKMVAEIGCGTGTMSILLSQLGYEMIGIDLSEDMLMVAREKALDAGQDILFLQQDMTELELFGSVDAFIATCDSLNYVDQEGLKKVLNKVNDYLNPGGLLIFDLNTKYKFKEIYNNQTFSEVGEDYAYIWENQYNEKEETNEYAITFFVEEENTYIRFDEYHIEHIHDLEVIKELIHQAGLKFVAALDDYSHVRNHSETERVTLIVTKE